MLALVGLTLLLDGLWLLRQQAGTRDAVRIADMARLEAAFTVLSYETGSYSAAAAGCGQVGATVDTCALARYLPTIAALKDPGGHGYVVTELPSENRFAVRFTLERGWRGLAKGDHTLSPDGIR